MKKGKNFTLNQFVTFVTIMLFPVMVLGQEAAKAPAPTPRPAFRMPVQMKSAEVMTDNKVTFRLYAKEAQNVAISGEWMQGFGSKENLARNDTGLFSITVGPLK